MDAVEVDPVVVAAARKFFYVEEDERFRIHIADGRRFLEGAADRFDVIILDAYVESNGKSGQPRHLMEPDFFRLARDHLTSSGLLIFNLTGTAWGETVKGALDTLKGIFASAYQFNVRSSLNVALVGSMAPLRDRQELRRRAQALAFTKGPTKLTFMDMANRLVESATQGAGGASADTRR